MKETTAKKKFMWNMAGSLCNSLSSMLLLIIVNRISGESRGGFFALAYSTAQLLFSVGGFEIRPVQSTDIKNKFTFNQYFTSRMLNCIIMLICMIGYIVVNGYTGVEALTVFRILGLRRIASSLGIRDCNSSTVNSPNGLPAIRKSMQNSLTGVNEESVVSIPRRCMRFNTAERAFRSRSLWSAILSPLILPDCKHSHISSYSVDIISRSDEVRPSVNCNTKVSLYRSRSIPFALAMA